MSGWVATTVPGVITLVLLVGTGLTRRRAGRAALLLITAILWASMALTQETAWVRVGYAVLTVGCAFAAGFLWSGRARSDVTGRAADPGR